MSTHEDAIHHSSDFHSTTRLSTQSETWRTRKLADIACIQSQITSTVVFFFFCSTIHDDSFRLQKTVSSVLLSQMFLNGTYLPWHFHCQNSFTYTHQQKSGVPKVSCNTQGLQFQEKTKSLNNSLSMSLPLKEEHWKLFRTFSFKLRFENI